MDVRTKEPFLGLNIVKILFRFASLQGFKLLRLHPNTPRPPGGWVPLAALYLHMEAFRLSYHLFFWRDGEGVGGARLLSTPQVDQEG